MALLDYLFPMQQIDTVGGLLGEDEARKIRQQSQIAGLLNFGANLLAQSGPSSQQRSFGQMLAPSLLAGYQAAQGTTAAQLQSAAAAQKMRQEQDVRNLMSQAFVPQYTERPATQTAIPSDVGPAVVETPATREITGYNLDLSKVAPQLAMRGRPDLIKNLAETQTLLGGKPAELSPQQQQFAQTMFGTTNFNQLSKEQQQSVLSFGQIPKADKALENLISAQNLVYNTGTGGEILRFAQMQYEMATGKQAPSQQQIANVVQSTQTPSGKAIKTEEPQQAQRKTVPMVDSPSLPLKDRQQLLLVKPQEQAATTSISTRMRDINETVDRLLSNPQGLKAATGFGGALTSAVSGSAAANAKADLDAIKSLISLAEIGKMRAESKTGGAVGNMTEKEWPRFEVVNGSLEQAQTYDQVVKNLRNLKGLTKETQESMLRKFDSVYGGADEIRSIVEQPRQVDLTGIPVRAIQMLQSNPTPEMKKFFDQKYGKGSADKALKGTQ